MYNGGRSEMRWWESADLDCRGVTLVGSGRFHAQSVHNKVISGFLVLRQARAFGGNRTHDRLVPGRTCYPLCHHRPIAIKVPARVAEGNAFFTK
ncbi:hypothetical protein PoB_004362800 [Plakobranchus ocellatus]|uniref:Uncharacterized protein n=1 Tax=Plakobranchus ocellatus TaxID=259542 RepID=A0AAV4BC33_9GAST|nr:hypothetical protein PoB_004362800 [Plakobranchus ocellatus]